MPPVTHGSAFQAPECLWSIIRGRIPSTGQVFIFVYRLAMDAKTRKGDGGAGGKYPSLLEDFLAATTSMARKRHLASTARGLFGLCLMAQIEVQEVQWVQIRPIRLIRGRNKPQDRVFAVFVL